METTRNCPDCPDESLVLIRLLDRGMNGHQSVGLEATSAAFTPQGWFKENAPGVIGGVHGLLCPACKQVRLYLISEEEAEQLFQEAKRRHAARGHERGGLSVTGDHGSLTLRDDS